VIPCSPLWKDGEYGKARKQRLKPINFFVIEDAAQALFGSAQKWKKLQGTWGGHWVCLSFYPTKESWCACEAGMCLTRNIQTSRSEFVAS